MVDGLQDLLRRFLDSAEHVTLDLIRVSLSQRPKCKQFAVVRVSAVAHQLLPGIVAVHKQPVFLVHEVDPKGGDMHLDHVL